MFMQERRDDGKREESVDNRWNTGKHLKNWLQNGADARWCVFAEIDGNQQPDWQRERSRNGRDKECARNQRPNSEVLLFT